MAQMVVSKKKRTDEFCHFRRILVRIVLHPTLVAEPVGGILHGIVDTRTHEEALSLLEVVVHEGSRGDVWWVLGRKKQTQSRRKTKSLKQTFPNEPETKVSLPAR